MKSLSDYIDSFGMVVTSQKDGGDSCAYGYAIGYASFLSLPNKAIQAYYTDNVLEKCPGRYCRHPDPSKWYSNPDTLSRDQFTPLLVFMGLRGTWSDSFRLLLAHALRGFLFAWNTRQNAALPGTPEYAWKFPDLTGPDIWATWIRILRLYPLYPLLILFDLPTLIGSIIYRYFSSSNLQMNQVLMVDFANRIMPTPTAWFAKNIYGKNIPIAALTLTFGDSTPMNPPVHEYLIPLVRAW